MDAARVRKFILNRLLVIVPALLVVAICLRIFENRLVFYPPRYPEGFASPKAYGLPVEEVWIVAEDGVRLNAYFLPNAASPMVILWFHGNAENIGMGLGQMKALSKLGTNILEIDYRGYGKSKGSPDEAGVYRDGEAAYHYLTASRHFSPQNIIVYGHSVGGGIAGEIAFRNPCGGLVIESSLTSARDMARQVLKVPGVEFIIKTRFDSLGKIPQVHAPVMIIHGTDDSLIPYSMGQRLFEAAHEPKIFVSVKSGHDDAWAVGGKPYWDAWKTFIDKVGQGRTG